MLWLEGVLARLAGLPLLHARPNLTRPENGSGGGSMRNRLASDRDLVRCAHLVPALADANDRGTRCLRAWLRNGQARASIYELGEDQIPFGIGVSGFVRRSTVLGWLDDAGRTMFEHLVAARCDGTEPLLDDAGIVQARLAGDLHGMVFMHVLTVTDPNDARVQQAFRVGADAYWLLFGGQGLSGVWHEMPAIDEGAAVAAGLHVLARHGHLIRAGCAREDLRHPFPSSMVEQLFVDLPTCLDLTPAQRRVAELALWRLDDEAIAQRLSVSPETVRRHWRDIHARMDDRLPSLSGPAEGPGGRQRGPDRRRHALEYLFRHVHEVRPRMERAQAQVTTTSAPPPPP